MLSVTLDFALQPAFERDHPRITGLAVDAKFLSHLFDAERALTQTQKKPEGLLRITAPVILGQESFYAFLSSFLKTYPHIQTDLFITICSWI